VPIGFWSCPPRKTEATRPLSPANLPTPSSSRVARSHVMEPRLAGLSPEAEVAPREVKPCLAVSLAVAGDFAWRVCLLPITPQLDLLGMPIRVVAGQSCPVAIRPQPADQRLHEVLGAVRVSGDAGGFLVAQPCISLSERPVRCPPFRVSGCPGTLKRGHRTGRFLVS